MGKSANKRIGILGGTFNPVHNGHLYIAKHAIKKLRLDKVIFVPAYIPPHKKIRGSVKTRDRVHMLRLALRGYKKFSLSTYEIEKKGKSYSVNTAKFFKRKYRRDNKLFFLIGADSLKGLKDWKHIRDLLKMLQFAVVPRPGFRIKKSHAGILKLNIPKKDVSSTGIRRLARKKKSIKRFVPEKVYKFIVMRNLYAG